LTDFADFAGAFGAPFFDAAFVAAAFGGTDFGPLFFSAGAAFAFVAGVFAFFSVMVLTSLRSQPSSAA
jgi:hypothetical protein